ncbi:hypothetical protein ACFO5Q_03275 [Kordiimonas lipolytica]|uniref:Uncharacterized protein n=1 Tax=Kordiimonas lipolytica TaxID=1662421 RepID=A0ABV8U6N9_9PROT|nr:hypothetical protein [Kordiimonas lipolytica]
MISFQQAKNDPACCFDHPADVVTSADLSDEQKIEILQRWEYDASEEAVAEEEGMRGAKESLLREIVLSLNALTGGLDLNTVSPNKHHGIPDSAIKSVK